MKAINDHLKAGPLKGKSFQGGMYYGLAKRVFVNDNEGKSIPAVITSDGHGTEVTPDDTYPFSIYHRCLSGGFTTGIDTHSFGNSTGISSANNMVAIVYADPKKVGVDQEDLAFTIASGLPEQVINVTDGQGGARATVKIVPTGFNNDSKQVFTGEYESAFGLKPQSIYFSLSYRIEITADRECVNCP